MSYWKIKYEAGIDPDDPELVTLNAKINAFKDALSRAPQTSQYHAELDRLQIIRQVRGTTGIEGNMLSEQAVEAVIRGQTPKDDEERETYNAYRALRYIIEQSPESADGGVSEELIKKLHAILTEGSSQNDNVSGQYRLQKIKVGHNFEGERFENIPEQMRAFVNYINRDDAKKWGELIRGVIAHFYLVSIHPFSDGNGRTARMLEDYILYHSDYNKAGFFSLSNFYYKNRDEYFEQLDDARFKYNGNLQHFVLFSLRGFLAELQANFDEVMREYSHICLSNVLEGQFLRKEISQRQYALLRYMIKYGETVDERAAYKRTDLLIKSIYASLKSERTIRRDIDELKAMKLLISQNKVLSVNYELLKTYAGINPDALFQPITKTELPISVDSPMR